MQALFLSFRQGAVVQIDLLEEVGGCDLNATARLLLKERYNEGDDIPDCCRGYLLVDGKLCLAVEEMV